MKQKPKLLYLVRQRVRLKHYKYSGSDFDLKFDF